MYKRHIGSGGTVIPVNFSGFSGEISTGVVRQWNYVGLSPGSVDYQSLDLWRQAGEVYRGKLKEGRKFSHKFHGRLLKAKSRGGCEFSQYGGGGVGCWNLVTNQIWTSILDCVQVNEWVLVQHNERRNILSTFVNWRLRNINNNIRYYIPRKLVNGVWTSNWRRE